jgi:hypothetical protein
MTLKFSQLTKFEYDVMEKHLVGDHVVLNALREQLLDLVVLSREFTGVGFYVKFSVPSRLRLVQTNIKERFCFSDVTAELPSIKDGIGLVLWVNDGLLSQLEGFTYTGEEWLPEMSYSKEYSLRYLDDQDGTHRDWEHLEKAWTLSPPN